MNSGSIIKFSAAYLLGIPRKLDSPSVDEMCQMTRKNAQVRWLCRSCRNTRISVHKVGPAAWRLKSMAISIWEIGLAILRIILEKNFAMGTNCCALRCGRNKRYNGNCPILRGSMPKPCSDGE